MKLVDDKKEDEIESIQENAKRERIRSKILTVGKVFGAYQNMRKEKEISVKVGHLRTSGGIVHESIKNMNEETLEKSLETFEGNKQLDRPLEARPPPKDGSNIIEVPIEEVNSSFNSRLISEKSEPNEFKNTEEIPSISTEHNQ